MPGGSSLRRTRGSVTGNPNGLPWSSATPRRSSAWSSDCRERAGFCVHHGGPEWGGDGQHDCRGTTRHHPVVSQGGSTVHRPNRQGGPDASSLPRLALPGKSLCPRPCPRPSKSAPFPPTTPKSRAGWRRADQRESARSYGSFAAWRARRKPDLSIQRSRVQVPSSPPPAHAGDRAGRATRGGRRRPSVCVRAGGIR
jgi:hypothetical protein